MNRQRTTSFSFIGLGLLAALALSAPSAEAQNRELRWLAFVGCWEAVGAEEEIGLLCFREADGGVELTNYLNGEAVSTEFLAADGRQRPVAAEGCEGWESVAFSEDGRRVFTTTEFSCAEGDTRRGTGIMAFTAPNFWVDVRVLDVGGEEVSWVQEYLLVGADRMAEEGIENPVDVPMAIRTSRISVSQAIDLDDVLEASGRVGARAVETWIVAHRNDLDVGADDLVRLADAGVPDRVIDAVVAVSYPDRFVVAAGEQTARMANAPRPTHYRGYMGYNPWFGPAWGFGYGVYSAYGYNPFYRYGGPYSGYRYGYGYGYDPYGYGYWGSRPGTVIIERRPADRGGRLYNGSGYRPGRAIPTGRTAQPRSRTPSFSTGGSGSGGAVAPSRGGSAGSGSARRARRRTGGS